MIFPTLQTRQEIAQEYEYVKDINKTLSDFKRDTFNTPSQAASALRLRDYNEPPTRETRDPDVWPPVERDSRFDIVKFSILYYMYTSDLDSFEYWYY